MDDESVNYAEMYLKMVRATESAIRTLIDAQRKCEEMYIQAGGSASLIDLREHRNEQ